MVRLFLFIGIILSTTWHVGMGKPSPKLKRIFIGVDGVSRENFDHARKTLGLFQTLSFVKTHVAPFPSISDYSWNILVGARKVHGPRGRIRSYEAAFFDRDRNILVSDPREYFRRLGEDHHYFSGAFRHWLNPFVEALLYVPTEELPKLELRQLREAIIADDSQLVTAMVASSDALAHTRSDGNRFLVELDQFITDLAEHYRKVSVDVEIILVSDHGQASRFGPGEKAIPLIPVELGPNLTRAGLELSKSLEKDQDVVMPVMALSNYATAHFKNPLRREKLLGELRTQNWFDLAVYPVRRSGEEAVLELVKAKDHARLTIRKFKGEFTYRYEIVSGNPLGLPESHWGQFLSDEKAREALAGSEYPDSFYRLAFSAFETEADLPDLIFTLKDDYYLAGELKDFTRMYQTHGALGRRSSSGILASTRPLRGEKEELRSEELLHAVGVTPHELFATTTRTPLKAEPGMIATGSETWDNRKIFFLMNRAVQDSQYVFDEKSLGTILRTVKPLLERKAPVVPTMALSEIVSLGDVAHFVDVLIQKGDLEKVKSDPKFQEIRKKIALKETPSTRAPSSSHSRHFHGNDLPEKADAAKKLVMKSYQGLTFFEKALRLPELPQTPDPRRLPGSDQLPKDIFAGIFRERQLLETIYPEVFPLHRVPMLPPVETTLVYVPGIYNSLFDDEIFRQGLDHLRQKWGVRVIAPKVFSTCSSRVNGEILMKALKEDSEDEVQRGKPSPRYIIFGYSKGGVDALHAFLEDPDFVSRHVEGLLTIASPLKGSSILNKVDLPLEVLDLLGPENSPPICRTAEKASLSLTPASAQGFLRKKAPILAGLTRYYSISFASTVEESHLFMRATKAIGRFGEPNDGVVAVSSSRFPEEYGAVDLGVVSADHLSGIIASAFPQKAFFEAALFTLGELRAFDREAMKKESEKTAYVLKKGSPEGHLSRISAHVGIVTKKIFDGTTEIDQLPLEIRRKLARTPYALEPFFLKKEGGVVSVNFRQGFWDFFSGGESRVVTTPEECHKVFLTSLQTSGRNLFAQTGIKVPESGRSPARVPDNELGFQEDFRLNLRKLEDFISGKRVTPATSDSHPEGLEFVYDHASSTEFRNEYQLSFEDSAPADADDNTKSGWESVLIDGKVWGKLSSENSSVRLTTYSWRFLAQDFPELSLDIQVNESVPGADVLFGGTGKDDSAFQLWFTFRILEDGADRGLLLPKDQLMTIGYYFGDTVPGKELELGEIYENYYSNKDFIVARLPVARQKLIGVGTEMLGKPLSLSHNLLEDIRRAYPGVDPTKAEVVAITIQHDSNDTGKSSEALFRSLSLSPSRRLTVKAD